MKSKIISSTLILLIISFILTPYINSKNSSSFSSKKENILLLKNALKAIKEKLDSEKDIHMIIRTYDAKNDKIQAQTKVHYTSYRKSPLCTFEEVTNLNLEQNTHIKFIYNKCKSPNHITKVSKKSKNKKFVFNSQINHT